MHVRAQVIWPMDSGLPEDAVSNTFHFEAPGTPLSEADADIIAARLEAFYDTAGTGATDSVGAYFSAKVANALGSIKLYNGSSLGSPLFEFPIDCPGPISGECLPAEVAGIVSFHADLSGSLEEAGATRPRARRRGRVYIGPLNKAAIDTATGLLSTAFRTDAKVAADTLRSHNESGDIIWSVYSTVDDGLREVVGGFVDNAPDTQRRRGVKATVRSLFGV